MTDWKEGDDGIYSATVPKGTKSRNLYVNGNAAKYARRMIANRKDFSYTSTGMTWTDPQYDWLQNTAGIEGGEIRFLNSFTERYNPIRSVGYHELVMVQDFWANNTWGWDTVNNPFADFGVWVQNARSLLTEGGQFYLDSDAGVVYYKPLNGEDMRIVETYLGILECLVSVSGTYDDLAHDITFSGLNFVGLGAQNVSVTDAHFAQVMGNAITAGEIQDQAHHPDSDSQINKGDLYFQQHFHQQLGLIQRFSTDLRHICSILGSLTQ